MLASHQTAGVALFEQCVTRVCRRTPPGRLEGRFDAALAPPAAPSLPLRGFAAVPRAPPPEAPSPNLQPSDHSGAWAQRDMTYLLRDSPYTASLSHGEPGPTSAPRQPQHQQGLVGWQQLPQTGEGTSHMPLPSPATPPEVSDFVVRRHTPGGSVTKRDGPAGAAAGSVDELLAMAADEHAEMGLGLQADGGAVEELQQQQQQPHGGESAVRLPTALGIVGAGVSGRAAGGQSREGLPAVRASHASQALEEPAAHSIVHRSELPFGLAQQPAQVKGRQGGGAQPAAGEETSGREGGGSTVCAVPAGSQQLQPLTHPVPEPAEHPTKVQAVTSESQSTLVSYGWRSVPPHGPIGARPAQGHVAGGTPTVHVQVSGRKG